MVASRSFLEEGGRGAEERREERRSISSRSSVGRVAVVLAGALDFEVVLVVGAASSRLLRALRRSWDFAARIRAALRDCVLLDTVVEGGHGGSTSVTASSSFCAGWFLVEPFGFRMLFARVT